MNACLLPLMGLLALAAGDDPVTARARADVESALKKLQAGIPPPRLVLSVKPEAGRGYKLEQASFTLDNQNLPSPATLVDSKGTEKVFSGEISPGPHELVVKMQYAGDFGLLSYMTGYKFKLQQKVEFDAPRGLEISLLISPKLDDKKEWQQRLGLKVDRSEEMLAQVDTSVPEPLPRPKLALADADADAGLPVAASGAAVDAGGGEEPERAAVANASKKAKRGKKAGKRATDPGAATETGPTAVAAAEPAAETEADEPEEAEAEAADAGLPEKLTEQAAAPIEPAPELPQPEDRRAYLFGGLGLLLVGAIALVLFRRKG